MRTHSNRGNGRRYGTRQHRPLQSQFDGGVPVCKRKIGRRQGHHIRLNLFAETSVGMKQAGTESLFLKVRINPGKGVITKPGNGEVNLFLIVGIGGWLRSKSKVHLVDPVSNIEIFTVVGSRPVKAAGGLTLATGFLLEANCDLALARQPSRRLKSALPSVIVWLELASSAWIRA